MHENNEREYAAIELNADKYGKILLAVFYRPLNANSVWVQHFIKTLANCTYEKILLLGIFPSVNLIGGSGFCNSSDSALFSFCQVLIEINSFSWLKHQRAAISWGHRLSNMFVTSPVVITLQSLQMTRLWQTAFSQPFGFNGLTSSLKDNPLESTIFLDNDDNWMAWKTDLCHWSTHLYRHPSHENLLRLHGLMVLKNSYFLWQKFQCREVKYVVKAKRVANLKIISENCFSSNNFNRLTKRSSSPDTVEHDNSSFITAQMKACRGIQQKLHVCHQPWHCIIWWLTNHDFYKQNFIIYWAHALLLTRCPLCPTEPISQKDTRSRQSLSKDLIS
jgi:hypothetical protein